MSIVYDNLAGPEVNLVADAGKVLLVFCKNILESGFELVGGVVSCLLELVDRVSHLVELLGVEVELIFVFCFSPTESKSLSLGRRFHFGNVGERGSSLPEEERERGRLRQ